MKKRLIGLILALIMSTIPLVGCGEESEDRILLKDKYEDYFSIGTAMGYNTASIYAEGENLVEHFNSMTVENRMKFAQLQVTEGNFYFGMADEQIDFAKEHNMEVRGHALLWYQSSPEWIFQSKDDPSEQATEEEVLDRIRTHIDTVAKHFSDDVYCWDVVNEAIADSGDSIYRESEDAPYYEITGTKYIEEAFTQARASLDEVGATDVKLFYNDYKMTDPAKRAKVIEMIKMLQEKDIPIDGIGIQGHYNIWTFDYTEFELAIKEFRELGLEIHITELDFNVYESLGSPELDPLPIEYEMLQAECYDKFFEICRDNCDIITNVTMWAVADDTTWLNHVSSTGSDRQNYPMLFDVDHQEKLAFEKVIDF